MWTDDIIPIPMKVRALQLDGRQFGVGDLNASRVRIGVKLTLDLQSCCGSGVGNKVDDDLVALQRTTSPVLRNVGEEPMFNLIPLASTWREITYSKTQTRVVGQLLQLDLPQAGP